MHLVDTTMFFCARGGGVKRYLLAKHEWLKKHASATRHTLLVPAPQRASTLLHVCDSIALKLADGYRLPLNPGAWRRQLLELEPDLIEAADPYVPAWAARQAAMQLRIPSVAFYHSDLPRLLAQRVGYWISPIARAYLRRLYEGFDLVLAPSAVMHEHLIHAGIMHAQIQPLGVDIDAFSPTRRDPTLRQRLGLSPQTRLLVYAGRFAREKNIPVLLATIERLGHPYHLLMIGGRRSERASACVTILPYQRSLERLATLVSSCDAFLHAGDQETYGLVAAEAMACGIPVVGVARGAMPELVDDSVGACAAAPTAAQLAASVASLFDRDIVALGRAAHLRAVTSYSWDGVFRQLISRYAQLTTTARMTSTVAAHARH